MTAEGGVPATTPLAAPHAPTGQPPRTRSRWRPRRRWLLALAAVAPLYVGVDAATGGAAPSDEAAPTVPTSTAEVATRTLAERLTLDGSLTYAGSAQLVGASTGTITWLPEVGTTVTAGQPLWRVDDVPVPLMKGALPQWRRFEASMSDGDDVEQLEENLRRLGHDPSSRMKVDRDFTAATAAAVKRWQKSLGRPQTGAVDVGSVVFYPTDVRVTEQLAAVGSQAAPGAALLKVSESRRVVVVELDARRQALISKGTQVEVELPDGRKVAGKVSSIGSVAAQEGEGAPTLDVTVDFASGVTLPPLDQAPVDVLVDLQSKEALAVPVRALLALSEGGYAVEVVEGRGRRLVAVKTGMFADGHVEVTGDLREGMKVTVPQ